MHLSKFLNSESGKYLMSVILGFGLATMFRFSCTGRNCVIYEAPNMNEIKDKIFRYNGECYTYHPVLKKCDAHQPMIPPPSNSINNNRV